MEIKPGKYMAKVLEGKIDKSKEKGTPYFGINFEIEGGQQVKWQGWLTENTKERTFEALAICGFDGNYDDNGYAPKSSFDPFVKIEIDVENEQYTDANGLPKTASKVKWVNKPGWLWGKTSGSAKDILGGIDLKKEMTVARQKMAKPIKNYAPQAAKDDGSSIPF
jgi:hypothetical protein